jgi:hypothetical protein
MKIYDDGTENYLTEKIIDSKINKRRKNSTIKKKKYLIYKIRYSEYNNYNNTSAWQPFIDVDDYPELIANFYYNFSSKSESHNSFRMSENWFSLNKIALSSK